MSKESVRAAVLREALRTKHKNHVRSELLLAVLLIKKKRKFFHLHTTHKNNNNFQREVDADNWSPGDWRKMSASYNNQNQKGGVSSAPFANDYTWDKERY